MRETVKCRLTSYFIHYIRLVFEFDTRFEVREVLVAEVFWESWCHELGKNILITFYVEVRLRSEEFPPVFLDLC